LYALLAQQLPAGLPRGLTADTRGRSPTQHPASRRASAHPAPSRCGPAQPRTPPRSTYHRSNDNAVSGRDLELDARAGRHPAQALDVDSFQRGRMVDVQPTTVLPEWRHWQRTELDTRQPATHRGALTFGHGFVLTETPATATVRNKRLSALRTAAVHEDPPMTTPRTPP
jgi:hypothetical protein